MSSHTQPIQSLAEIYLQAIEKPIADRHKEERSQFAEHIIGLINKSTAPDGEAIRAARNRESYYCVFTACYVAQRPSRGVHQHLRDEYYWEADGPTDDSTRLITLLEPPTTDDPSVVEIVNLFLRTLPIESPLYGCTVVCTDFIKPMTAVCANEDACKYIVLVWDTRSKDFLDISK
uniref:Uncharacterized protein n=1 Tax=viral metagenome TaxID=1070528 RepID=A0A6C0J6L0_9ZZZZ